MQIRTRIVPALVLGFVLAHCGSSVGAGADGPTSIDAAAEAGPPTVDDFPARYGTALCRHAFACVSLYNGLDARTHFVDEVACIGSVSGAALLNWSRSLEEVAAGRLVFDAAAADRCLRELTVCDEIPATCDSVFVGTVALGGRCSRGAPCAPGGYCALDPDPATGAVGPCGTCRATLPLGASCNGDSSCDGRGLAGAASCRVGLDGTDAACREYRALRAAAEGEACGPRALAPFVVESTHCGPGLVCNGERCVRPRAVGESCQFSSQCASGMACAFTAAPDPHQPPPGTCQPIVLVDTEGEACGGARLCNALRGLHCGDDRCVSSGDGGVGSRCRQSDAALDCNDGLACVFTPGADAPRCAPPGADGAACVNHEDCRSLVCSSADRRCRPATCS